MTSSKFKVQSSIFSDLQSSPLNSELRTPNSGFTYISLLAAVVIIGITLGAAGKYWSHVMLREKEEELLFRGEQYRQAIERYYTAIPTVPRLPASIDDLLKDGRTATGKRHLRQKYKDPISGEDFVEIREKLRGNGIIGVHSPSEKIPLKQGNFPEKYKQFEGKQRYSEWWFAFTIPGQQGQQVPLATSGSSGGSGKDKGKGD
jgi:type II secretory pathway pseudopilin PulG